MLIEEKYPRLQNPTGKEWRVIAVRSAIFVFACILVSASAYLFMPKRSKRGHENPKAAASTRANVFYSPATSRNVPKEK